jgi:hypothetical protein
MAHIIKIGFLETSTTVFTAFSAVLTYPVKKKPAIPYG